MYLNPPANETVASAAEQEDAEAQQRAEDDRKHRDEQSGPDAGDEELPAVLPEEGPVEAGRDAAEAGILLRGGGAGDIRAVHP